ncbi:unnamed protein product, partial [Rotaria magnacalcarata]
DLEFDADEYCNYTYICQQANERIEIERKSREQAELEALAAATASHTGKRRHRNKKNNNNNNKQEENGSIVSTTSEEHPDL